MGRQSFLQHFRIALYDHQHIVEIMSDAASKPTDGFHFLRLAKLLLKRKPLTIFQLALGEIMDKHNRAVRDLGR